MTTLQNERAPVTGDFPLPLDMYPEDTVLVNDLRANGEPPVLSPTTGIYFANSELGDRARPVYTLSELVELEEHLEVHGTIEIPFRQGSVIVDGVERGVLLVAATDTATNHGDMSANLYLRDQVQAARAMMELTIHYPERYREQGQTAAVLLTSALHLMSTPTQLQRLENVIEKGSKREKTTQADWPNILMDFNDLSASNPNGWRNKQDTLQMLAYAALDALEYGVLAVDDLAEAHKQFLGSVVPFLAAVGYPRYENCGSWEEVPAVRTSVMAIETALLHKIGVIAGGADAAEYAFLEAGYQNAISSHPGLLSEPAASFQEVVLSMEHAGLAEISRRLPHESPDTEYDSVTSPQYREADAALAYLLMYGIPQLIAETTFTDATAQDTAREEIETAILEQLLTLMDNETNGMSRYQGDAYQRSGYYTKAVQDRVDWIKKLILAEAEVHGGEPDYARKQHLRNLYVPEGRTATWVHPLGQISAWAAKRALSLRATHPDSLDEVGGHKADKFHELSTRLLNFMLSTITGNQMHPVLNGDGSYHAKRVPSWRLPESIVSYDGVMVPSPNTPLNWGAATLAEALGMLITYADRTAQGRAT